MFGQYKNYHQIYTHATNHGVIVGQRWYKPNGSFGTVRAITERGYVILDPLPKLIRCTNVPLKKLVTEYTLSAPVVVLPYQRVNKTIGWQVFTLNVDRSVLYVFGELRRDFDNVNNL